MSLTLRAKLRLPAGCTDAQLQEACSRYHTIYKGVLDSATDESVKAIARARLEDLVASARAEGVSIKEANLYYWDSPVARIPASVEAELGQLNPGAQITESKANQLKKMIDDLPDSPKRHYLRALVTLRSKDSSTETYREVVGMLKPAVTGDPENPVYSAMVEDIEQETNRYLRELEIWRRDKELQIAKENRKEMIKKILSGTGSVLLWLLGAALTVAGVIFSCWCSICGDAC